MNLSNNNNWAHPGVLHVSAIHVFRALPATPIKMIKNILNLIIFILKIAVMGKIRTLRVSLHFLMTLLLSCAALASQTTPRLEAPTSLPCQRTVWVRTWGYIQSSAMSPPLTVTPWVYYSTESWTQISFYEKAVFTQTLWKATRDTCSGNWPFCLLLEKIPVVIQSLNRKAWRDNLGKAIIEDLKAALAGVAQWIECWPVN